MIKVCFKQLVCSSQFHSVKSVPIIFLHHPTVHSETRRGGSNIRLAYKKSSPHIAVSGFPGRLNTKIELPQKYIFVNLEIVSYRKWHLGNTRAVLFFRILIKRLKCIKYYVIFFVNIIT